MRLWVGSLTTANDFFAVPFDDASSADDNGVTELDVLANDRVLQGRPGGATGLVGHARVGAAGRHEREGRRVGAGV
ncbi:MAG: hypothetical protein M5U12_33810 [Verrucomicrobia bacterium]|nr:hypothetical protein [Verrucomicrobiota bacterium]